MKKYIFLLAIASVILPSNSAWALRASLVGAANYSSPKVIGGTHQAIWDYGWGGLLEFSMVPFVGIEFGALYLPRKYEYSSFSTTTTITRNMVEFPVLLRAHVGSALSLGIGGYYGKYYENVHVTTQTGSSTSSYTATYGTQGVSDTDYGFATSIALYIPITPAARLLLDGRYTISAKDNDKGGGDLKFNDIQALAGLQIGF